MTDLREEILLQKKVEKETQRALLSTNDPTIGRYCRYTTCVKSSACVRLFCRYTACVESSAYVRVDYRFFHSTAQGNLY